MRRVVLGGLEQARNARVIGSSLQAHPVVCAPLELVEALKGMISLISALPQTLRSVDPLSGEASLLPMIRHPGCGACCGGAKCQRC